MSLRLLVDEDTQDKLLIKFLREAGHEVLSVNEANLMGKDDPLILDYAKTCNYVLLTLNCKDFRVLHQESPLHQGILAIYQEADSSKKMSFRAIVKAIANIEAAQIPLAGQFVNLNQWNY